MEKEAAATALRSLAEGTGNRSEAARLRDLLPDIEATLQAGVKRSAVLEALHAQGFTMTMKGFENTLYRLRKNKAKAAPTPAAEIQQTTQGSTPAPNQPKQPPEQPGQGDTTPKKSLLMPERKVFKPNTELDPSLLDPVKPSN